MRPTSEGTKFRLITRHDFDGLASAVLLKELGMIEELDFVHPKDMQDGKVRVSSHDISTNLPYAEGIHLAFDHHASEANRVGRASITFSTQGRRRLPRCCTIISAARRSFRPIPGR